MSLFTQHNIADSKFDPPSACPTRPSPSPRTIESLSLLSSLKMVIKHKVEGFEAFVAKAEELSADKTKTLIVMFSGTKDENGKSWCPDCVVAEPVVDECLAGKSKF